MTDPTSLGALATPEMVSTVIRAGSTPLRGSLRVRDVKSWPLTSSGVYWVWMSEMVAFSAMRTRLSTSDSQRCWAICSAEATGF